MKCNKYALTKRILITLTCLTLLIKHVYSFAEPIKPQRLKPGDTIQLIAPSHLINPQELQFATERMQALGFKVIVNNRALDRYGYFAGKPLDKAKEINEAFANKEVKAIIAVRGGSGASLVLDHIDYELVAQNPKIVIGYSDVTALLVALNQKASLVTFHGPLASSKWPEFTRNQAKTILLDAQAPVLENLNEISNNDLIQTKHRTTTITPGKTTGTLMGGNLTVLSTLMGSEYFPSNWEGSILFLEDVGENLYSIDRMLAQLKNAGVLDQISGFIFGTCVGCEAKSFGNFYLEDILTRHIKPLNIPAYSGAMIGHQDEIFTLPIGINVEMDASLGTITLLEPAVQ